MEIERIKRELTITFTETDMREILEFMNAKDNDNTKGRSFGVRLTPLGKLLKMFEKEIDSMSNLD